MPADRRDPGRATTAGVGRLLAEARAAGATRIVVGLGGSGTNDAGAGALLAAADAAGVDLPGRVRDLLGRGGAGLHGATASDLAPLTDVRAAWADTTIVVATDVDAPLLGPHGASLGFGPQKGASPDQAKDLESALMGFAGSAIAATGVPQRMVATPGAGAAGGLGFGLMLLGGLRSPGIDAVADAVRLRERIAATDLVITGEGKLDWQSLQGKVVAGRGRTRPGGRRPGDRRRRAGGGRPPGAAEPRHRVGVPAGQDAGAGAAGARRPGRDPHRPGRPRGPDLDPARLNPC